MLKFFINPSKENLITSFEILNRKKKFMYYNFVITLQNIHKYQLPTMYKYKGFALDMTFTEDICIDRINSQMVQRARFSFCIIF